MHGYTAITADIPPVSVPTEPSVPEATTSQPSTTPELTSADWTGGTIAIAVVAVLALMAAVVAISIVVARRA
ncbi:MAG: hypothetical protein K1X95_07005 [Acidimicrobiia bacterium]|nr:hypothetical protein [Acidimicrobiia bacterium]